MIDITILQALITALLQVFPKIPAGIATFIQSLTSQLPTLVLAGTDIEAFISAQMALVQTMVAENRDPTQAEWDALNTDMAAEMAKLTPGG